MSRLTTTARMDVLRARVLRLLEETDAGASENWRDSDPGYWIGAAEGAFAAERERDEALEVLRGIEWFGFGFCPVCNGEKPQGHYKDCSLAQILRPRSGGSDRGEGEG